MSFFHYMKHLISSNSTKSEEVTNQILSKEVFRRVLERERARADRYGDRFSLAVFEVGHSNKHQINVHLLAQMLLKRIRPTDEVGWFKKDRVGIVLPNTTPWGAKKLSEDICRQISNRKPPPVFKIYTYPSKELSGFNEDLQNIFCDENEFIQRAESEIPRKTANQWNCEILVESLEPFLGPKMPAWKRAIDIFGAAIGLVLLFPLITFIAIVIKMVSPGPVLFKQKRIGYRGKPFVMLKFRSMKFNADPFVHINHVTQLIKDGKPLAKMDNNDSRIFPFGKFLRLTGLDELPQFINILNGEMSLIGPRPELLSSLRHCERWHSMRFDAKPGLSGLWQVSDKTATTFNEMMRLDISYVKKMSFWLDALIFLKTFPTVVTETRKH